ncbi:unnamed protein product [Ambrosiozyma monospora]|uniref:Unnamed protein product n=1 Tax=Ambrosiozyma monospora TaxID=43982 RepID=A0ACB5TYB3_AMBMO|nr:unnamed protein product [Ambrosiozyma monospora]
MDTILDNISAIPAAAEPEWPPTSPATNPDGSPTNGINHITLEDWKKNAEKWMKSKERLGMGNSKSMFFNEGGRPPIADARKPKFARSVSDPSSFSSSHSTIEEKIQQLKPLDDRLMLKPCYIPPIDDDEYENLDEHEYKTIMNESFVSSYQHIAKISMSSLADLNSTNNNLASYSYPQEPQHSRSGSKASPTGKLNLTGSPSSSLRKSRSSSPLKRFKSLKKLVFNNNNFSRIHQDGTVTDTVRQHPQSVYVPLVDSTRER